MAITLSNTTISGIGSGGIGSGVITGDTIASGTISGDRLASSARANYLVGSRSSAQGMGGGVGWTDHISFTFSVSYSTRVMFLFCSENGYESSTTYGFHRFVLNGNKIGYNACTGRQMANNCAGAGNNAWYADVSAGTHTITVQQAQDGGGTWYSPYWTVDGEGANTLGVFYYG
jgi:hypothetical protein